MKTTLTKSFFMPYIYVFFHACMARNISLDVDPLYCSATPDCIPRTQDLSLQPETHGHAYGALPFALPPRSSCSQSLVGNLSQAPVFSSAKYAF